jgi:hypothetical protein
MGDVPIQCFVEKFKKLLRFCGVMPVAVKFGDPVFLLGNVPRGLLKVRKIQSAIHLS